MFSFSKVTSHKLFWECDEMKSYFELLKQYVNDKSLFKNQESHAGDHR